VPLSNEELCCKVFPKDNFIVDIRKFEIHTYFKDERMNVFPNTNETPISYRDNEIINDLVWRALGRVNVPASAPWLG